MTDLRGLRETLRDLRYRKPQPKFCPMCKSHDIFPFSILGILPTTYVCRECGYKGILTVELEPEQRKTDEQDAGKLDPEKS